MESCSVDAFHVSVFKENPPGTALTGSGQVLLKGTMLFEVSD